MKQRGVRLENRRLPLGLRSLMHELQETIKDKEDCIKEHDFEAAKQLLDHNGSSNTYSNYETIGIN
jgi:hypothetical protein